MVLARNAAEKRDLATGIIIAAIGAGYFAATFAIKTTDDVVTPGTFPAIVGIALLILGVFLAVRTVVVAGRGARADGPRNDAAPPDPGGGTAEAPAAGDPEPTLLPVVVQFALFFVYLAVLIPLGFLLATAAFLMAVTSIYSPGRWLRNLIFSVLFSAAVYFSFVFGLGVYLPPGIVG